MTSTKIFRWFALDMAIWACVPTLFLFAYVHYQDAPPDAVLPHYRLVLLSFLCLAVLRITLSQLIPNRFVTQLAAASVTALLLIILILYYSLVLVGLGSWGQVISYDLMASYATQIPDLADTLGISVFLAVCAILFGYALLLVAASVYIRRFDWTPHLARYLGGWRAIGITAFGVAICATEILNFTVVPATNSGEPVALTFFPRQASKSLQIHAIDKFSAERLDRVEDAERRAYKIIPQADRRNLVLIVVDALRPDHLSVYGYERDTTPNLRSLQKNGVLRRVSGVRSSCGESMCGLLSLASSKFVHQFSHRPFTLQQVLKLHGYRIHMILGGDHTNFYGLKELYGNVDTYFDGSQAPEYFKNDDRLVVDRTKALPHWDGHPVMLQFHLMSAHVMGKRQESSLRYLPSVSYGLSRNQSAEHMERAVNYYDNGVVQTDAVIHDLLATLKAKHYLDNTLVVITGDHGESLGEHGLFAHANSVREEALRVPLILLSYGYVPAPLPEHVPTASQVDIAPTMLAELGFVRPRTWTGMPLQNFAGREFSYFQEGNDVGLIHNRDPQNLWKFWMNMKTQRQYAFNLSEDPHERHNAVDSLPAEYLKTLRLQLMQLRSVGMAPQ